MFNNPITEIKRRLYDRRPKDSYTRINVPNSVAARKTWKYLSHEDLRGFKNLLFAARAIVEGHYAGKHKSPYRGSAPEFVDYREYYPGDELRSIDWRCYARTDRYFVKLFEKETDMNCHILLDRSASMDFGSSRLNPNLPDRGISKLEYGCYLTAALTYLMVRQGDKVGLTLFSEDIDSDIPPGGTFAHMYQILNELETCRAGMKTRVSEVLRKANGLFKRRGLLIVISDFLDHPEEIFRSLGIYAHRGFEILLFHILHQDEIELPEVSNAHFIDSESGDRMTCSPPDLRVDYNHRIRKFISLMISMSRARGMEYHFVSTATAYASSLERYLLKRRSL